MPTIRDPDFDLIFRAVKALHRRVELLENKQDRIARNMESRAKILVRLYNRYYAQSVRRKDSDANILTKIAETSKRWERIAGGGTLLRLAHVLRKTEKGMILPMIPRNKYNKFWKWMNEDFRSAR